MTLARWFYREMVGRRDPTPLVGGTMRGSGLALFLVADPTSSGEVAVSMRDGGTLAVLLGGALLAASIVAVPSTGHPRTGARGRHRDPVRDQRGRWPS